MILQTNLLDRRLVSWQLTFLLPLARFVDPPIGCYPSLPEHRSVESDYILQVWNKTFTMGHQKIYTYSRISMYSKSVHYCLYRLTCYTLPHRYIYYGSVLVVYLCPGWNWGLCCTNDAILPVIVSQSGMKDQSGMNPKLLIGLGKNWFRVSSSKLRVIGNTHHRVDVYFLHLAIAYLSYHSILSR